MPRVLVATLADAVDAGPGKKFNVLGGGIDTFGSETLPISMNRLALLVALEIAPGETSDLKALAIFKDTEGTEFMRLDMDFGSREPGGPRTVIWAGANLPPMAARTPGRMTIEVSSGDSRFELGLQIKGPAPAIFPTPTGTSPN